MHAPLQGWVNRGDFGDARRWRLHPHIIENATKAIEIVTAGEPAEEPAGQPVEGPDSRETEFGRVYHIRTGSAMHSLSESAQRNS
jgi:hypothetical protein